MLLYEYNSIEYVDRGECFRSVVYSALYAMNMCGNMICNQQVNFKIK